VVLGLGGAGNDASAHAEARRLAASLQVASEEALVADRSIALSWDAEGYSFVVGSAGGWAAHTAPSLGERHALPDDISLAVDSEAQPFPINENTSLSVTFSGGTQSWIVRFDGVGATIAEVTGG
jgi:general secretion pathway protein H